ncbi:hypothetical protein SDC9_212621 [bioreactor metagenome]|uniref:Uncharacterized protein n=1 Tax=bioreactor metagenome TaxID=1076179 RepID=A0A645K140_9ZZZZ
MKALLSNLNAETLLIAVPENTKGCQENLQILNGNLILVPINSREVLFTQEHLQ